MVAFYTYIILQSSRYFIKLNYISCCNGLIERPLVAEIAHRVFKVS